MQKLWRSQSCRFSKRGSARGLSAEDLRGPERDRAAAFLDPGGQREKRTCGWSAGMHRLRTTVARLRPLTMTQTAQSLSQSRLLLIERGLRTFQPLRQPNTSVTAEPFLNGTSSNYVEEMYYAWLEDPKNVHKVLYAWKPTFAWKLAHIKKRAMAIMQCPAQTLLIQMCAFLLLNVLSPPFWRT